jgi:hypothetical protein
MTSAIAELGFVPRRRNVFYELLDDPAPRPAAVDRDRAAARAVVLPVATP